MAIKMKTSVIFFGLFSSRDDYALLFLSSFFLFVSTDPIRTSAVVEISITNDNEDNNYIKDSFVF